MADLVAVVPDRVDLAGHLGQQPGVLVFDAQFEGLGVEHVCCIYKQHLGKMQALRTWLDRYSSAIFPRPERRGLSRILLSGVDVCGVGGSRNRTEHAVQQNDEPSTRSIDDRGPRWQLLQELDRSSGPPHVATEWVIIWKSYFNFLVLHCLGVRRFTCKEACVSCWDKRNYAAAIGSRCH